MAKATRQTEEAPIKASEILSATTTAAPPKKRGPRVKTANNSGTSASILGQTGAGTNSEPVKSPLEIINQATPDNFLDEEDFDAQLNPIEAETKDSTLLDQNDFANTIKGNKLPGVTTRAEQPIKFNKQALSLEDEELPPLPQIRKVVLRKIDRYVFKLGMEKLKEKISLIPGVSHTFVCDMKGDEYVTGLEGRDEDRKRLERALRRELHAKSSFWGELSFRMEDKEHGQILNFDDPQLGARNEAVYFAMLGSSIIANGYQEYSTGIKPFAEWFIEDKEAEAETKQKEMTWELEASNKFQEISDVKKKGAAKLLGLSAFTNNSPKVYTSELWQFIKKGPENAKAFLDLMKKHETEFNVRVEVADAIRLNVLRKNRAAEYFIGDVVLGPNIDQIVSKLALPQYAEVRDAIKNQLDKKNR